MTDNTLTVLDLYIEYYNNFLMVIIVTFSINTI